MRIAWDCPAGAGDTACRPPAKGPVKVRAVGEYIIRDGDGRDISDEVVLKRSHCWKCKRVTYRRAGRRFMFGCPTPEDFVAPYTIELIEEWGSA